MLPDYLPRLPTPLTTTSTTSWPANIIHAHQIVSDIYSHALQALHTDAEKSRLQFHCRALVNDAFPLILAFELGDEEYPVLKEWVYKVAEILMELLQQLQEAEGHPSTG